MGETGKPSRCRLVAACRDRAPPISRHAGHGTGSSGGPTDLLMLFREMHEEYHTAKGSLGAMQKDGRVVLNRHIFIYKQYCNSIHALKLIYISSWKSSFIIDVLYIVFEGPVAITGN